jgi:hypothetical protein
MTERLIIPITIVDHEEAACDIASGKRDEITMDNKQLMIIAAGIIVLAIVVLAAAFVVLNDNGGPAATPTPVPAATPEPAAGASTASPAPAAAPAQTVTVTPGPGGPIIVQAQVQANGTGICFVSIYLNTGASPVDVSHLKMNIDCDGRVYSDVWTLKASDWAGSNGNTLLEPKEALAIQIDTKALGIPQGRPFTIKVLQDIAVLQETTVTPT